MLAAHVGVIPVEVGLPGENRCRYHSPGVPSAFVVRVQVVPEKLLRQEVGIPSRRGRGRDGTRTGHAPGEPGPAASACRNQGCWSETWLGTTSTMVRMPSSSASAMSASASASDPKPGSMAR